MSEFRKWKIGYKVLFVFYLAAAILFFYSCYYADFYETGLEGVRFWDILFEGNIHNFYSQVFLIGKMQYVPLYAFPMYIIFAVWNFPLWVVQKVSGIDIYHSVPCLMWMKSMLLVWTALFLKEFGGVIREVLAGQGYSGTLRIPDADNKSGRHHKYDTSVSGLASGRKKPSDGPEDEPEDKPENGPENGSEDKPEDGPENGSEDKPEDRPKNGPEVRPGDGRKNGPEVRAEDEPENGPEISDGMGTGESAVREGRFLFLTATFFMTGLIVLGQYDIICMTFMMKGLQAYLRGNTKENTKKFVLWFALSAPLKYFSLLVFVPLVLIREKRISRILLAGIEVMIPTLFFRLVVPYGRADLVPGCTFSGSSEGTNEAKTIFDALYVRGSVGFGTLFIYIAGMVLFLVCCYAFRMREQDDEKKIAVYLCYMAYVIQFTLGYSHPYWLILLVPFMILIILQNERYHYINLLLETVLTAAMAAAQIFYYTWCFNAGIVRLSFWQYLLPGGIPSDVNGSLSANLAGNLSGSAVGSLAGNLSGNLAGNVSGGNDYSVITVLSRFITDPRLQDYASGIFLSIYAACMLAFAVINFPLWKRPLPITEREKGSYHWLYVLRGLLTVVCGSVPLVLYFCHAFLT